MSPINSLLKTGASLGAGIALGLVGACASTPPPTAGGRALPTTADLHEITVSEVGERLDLAAPAQTGGLDAASANAIRSFVGLYRASGSGPMTVSAPRNELDSEGGRRFIELIRSEMKSAGLPASAVAVAEYEGEAGAPVTLAFSRFTAEAPQCRPLSEQDLSAVRTGDVWESFGCSMQANLAAMIADPRDLATPAALAPSDADRRAVVLGKYRAGEQTHSDRSTDERVTISDAVK